MKFHLKEVWVLTNGRSIRRVLKLSGKGPKKFKERNIGEGEGVSLYHVHVGAKIHRMLERTIRMNVSRSNMVFATRQKTARDLLEEHGIPFHRPRRKHA